VGPLEVIIKRIKPNFFVRIYRGLAFSGTTIFGLCTIGGLVFALYSPQNFCWYYKILPLVIILFIGLSVAYARGKQKLLPSTLIDELSGENSYSVSFCSREGLREADEMTRPYYGTGFIPFDQIEQWRLKNEKGFVQINNKDGLLCACFVILGLESSFFDEFIAGKLTEHEIDGNVILPFDSMKREDRIYISGVVVRDPGNLRGGKRTRIMLWTMLEYFKKVFALRKTRALYAVGLTKEAEKLLHAMEFKIWGSKESRKDHSNLYRIDLDKETWLKMLTKVGIFSKMVSFSIDL